MIRAFVRQSLLIVLAGIGLGVQAAPAASTLTKFHADAAPLTVGGWSVRPGTTVLGTTAPARTWATGGTADAPTVASSDFVRLVNAPGAGATAAVVSTVGLLDAGIAVASVLAPQVGAVLSAGQLLYSAYRIATETVGDGSAPTLRSDPGASQASRDTACVRVNGRGFPMASTTQCFSNIADACAADVLFWGPVNQYSVNGTSCSWAQTSGYQHPVDTWQYGTTHSAVPYCPASVDALNPAFSVPEGAAPGADGLCPTARYNHVPVSPADAAARLTAKPPKADDLSKALQEALIAGASAVASQTLSGPAAVTGTPTTSQTVNPDGSTVSTTNTPSYAYDYSKGDQITYTTVNNVVTNTCTGAGACGTATTNTSTPGTPVAPAPVPDPTGCVANPSGAGCGGAPAGQPTLYTPKTATYTQALSSFKSQLLASPLGSAMGGYFTVTGGGSCPTFAAHIGYINADVVIDQFCAQWATNALAFLKTAVMVVAGIAAFRIAAL